MPARPQDLEFTNAPFMTVARKVQVYAAWLLFLRDGFTFRRFTVALYEHLIQHCSFIAHYDRLGFYRTYFDSGEATVRFVEQFTTGVSAEYGSSHWLSGDCADINKAMCEAARELAPPILQTARERQRAADVAEAENLLAKHGISAPRGP